MISHRFTLFLVFIFSILVSPSSWAKEGQPDKAGQVKVQADERIRYYYRKNLLDLENSAGTNYSYMQFRTRLGMYYSPGENIKLAARLLNENKAYFYPSTSYEINEVVFDKLYLETDKVLGLPFSLKIGRQDLFYGEGFVICDGTPGDGPRSIYFNAVKGSINTEKNKIDVLVIRQDKQDRFIKINDQDANLNNNKTQPDIEAAGFYLTNNSFKDLQIESYYIYKHEFSTAVKSEINTMGLRASGKLNERLDYAAEYALQLGETGNNDKEAMGLTCNLTYHPVLRFNPAFRLEYTYLSGDDPNTGDDEGWNPVFSQWPKWSLLYTYVLNNENGMAYWTNLHQLRLVNTLNFTPKQKLDVFYSYLRADDNNFSGAVFGTGKERGHIFGIIHNAEFNEYLSGRLKTEYFIPGDYYASSADPAFLVQLQMIIKY